MAGAMRKVGVYLGLVEDTDRYEDDFDEHDSYDEPERAREARPVRAVRPESDGGVTSIAERRRASSAPETAEVSRITTLHPRTYNEARTIGENFREGVPVIMNLTEMDDNDAKRLVDFAAGLVFAVHGSIERVTSKVFLLSPPNVTVAAEDKQRIVEGGFFNQS
ncbi:MAG TPA: cell division protein SepF [Nocardioidaceae bacterium]|nr:cell division protein SepF [Nocardioidaceae bacterium]